ncbi:MAG: sulfatase-like hydrolase/transferase [Chloroflexota bacterium]|nr:sulfatase-like hydrolase/transferase [Chloroflexota bacterium]
MTDQQKATAIDLYGGPVRTPHLARLAADGTLYQHAFTPHPLCVPARVAFWTGRWPHSTGARTNETPMPRGETHLAGLLHGAGYRLGHFGKNHCFTQEDFDRYFDHVFLAAHGDRFGPGVSMVRSAVAPPPDPASLPPEPGFRRPVARVRPEPPQASATYRVTEEACHYLEAHAGDDEPLCLWVSIPDPHEPYQVPHPYAAYYPPESLPLPPWPEGELEHKPERQRVYEWLLGWRDLSAADARLAMSIYYGMIAFIDERVGVLLDTLERLGLREDTIVLFTSDHGDYMGEHHMLIKSNAFYDCLTRVPLLVSWPGHLPAGERRPELVSTMDVMPTVLTLLGMEVPEGVQGRVLPGVPDAPDAAGAPPAREAVFAEYGAGGPPVTLADVERLFPPGTSRVLHPLLRQREGQGHGKMVRTRRWKYTHDTVGDGDELYDLQDDPGELTNLAGDPRHATVVAEMQRLLLDWCLETEDARPVPLFYDTARLIRAQ